MDRHKLTLSPRAFTLVELLVVISIIALLLAILMPSLNKARQAAYAIKCGANSKNMGAAALSYTTDYEYFPCSYVYPNDSQGNYDLNNQTDKSFGYLHWSYFLFENGRTNESAFTCPAIPHGGIPRTNPGPQKKDWEAGQIDNSGQNQPNNMVDKQAARMAYVANGAIIPRNKFTPAAVTADNGNYQGRVNKFVKPGEIKGSGSTIMAAEYSKDWKAITGADNGNMVKSHRPVEAFYSLMSGDSGMALYATPNYSVPCYGYGPAPTRGILKLKDIQKMTGLIDGAHGSCLNAVGRHHPGQGSSADYGECANFLYCDGHVERKSVLSTVQNFEWGTKFYSITGNNAIDLSR